MSSSLTSFEQLAVWKAAREVRKEFSALAKRLPADERYRLANQMIRSSRSVAANIAEGFGRFHYQENLQYCRQARGSLTETLEHLICALDEGYISEDEFCKYKASIVRCWKMINGYIAYLKKAATAK